MRIVIIAGAENYFTPLLSNADRVEHETQNSAILDRANR